MFYRHHRRAMERCPSSQFSLHCLRPWRTSASKTVVVECWRDGLRSVDLDTPNDEDLRLKFATLLRTGVRTSGTTFFLYFDYCSLKYVFLIYDHPCGLMFRPLRQKDRERSVYYLKEATIAKAFIRVMGIDKTPDAIALLHWKKPMPGQVYSLIIPFDRLTNDIEGNCWGFPNDTVGSRSKEIDRDGRHAPD